MDSRYKILVVDDDPVARDIARDVLTGEGYEVIEAVDGNGALRKVVVAKPDLILLDLIMPGIDGFEVCRRLRRDMDNAVVPIIIFSARAEKDDILKGLEVGANDYIIKPLDPFELRAKIKTHLHLKGLYDEASAEKRDLAALLKVSQAVSSTLHSSDVLYAIVRGVAEIIEVSRCSIVKIGNNKGIGHVITTYEDPNIRNFPIDLSKYPEIKKALKEKNPVIVDDVQNDPLMNDVKDALKSLEFTSLLVIPIRVREEIVGTLFLRTSRKQRNFTQREIRLCEVIANMAGNALANAHLFEAMELANLELEKLAVTDGLTGAHNHRYFRSRLNEEFGRALRYNTFLSCIMLDIDHFKNINDAFGHGQGDIVLKEITDVIKNNVRKIDIVARYGGEEFVILLPHTDKDGAFIQAERVRNAVKGYRCRGEDRCIMVTISLGVATSPSEEIKHADDLVGLADNALYKAKAGGRDQTVSA